MEIQGKVIRIFPIEQGESKSGKAWKKQNFVMEYTDGQFAKKVLVTVKADPLLAMVNMFRTGEQIKCQVFVEAREWNDRFFTDVTAWKIEKLQPESEAVPF